MKEYIREREKQEKTSRMIGAALSLDTCILRRRRTLS